MGDFRITEWAERTLGVSAVTLERILVSVAVILALWIARRLLLRGVERRVEDVQVRYRWRKSTMHVAAVIGIIAMARIWIHGFTSLSTMVGLISAGVAIALKDPLANMAGWLFIVWRQPFAVGDRIQVGSEPRSPAGDVIDQRLFAFTLMEIGNWVDGDQSTGRVIHVPNGRVFTQSVANYSKGFQYIWDEVGVTVTFESNWRRAKELLAEIANRHGENLQTEAESKLREASRKFMIFFTRLTPIVYTSVRENGVRLTLRYLTEPQRRRGRMQAIWEDVLEAFADCADITFAYPTTRVFLNPSEGKPGVRASAARLETPPDPSEGYPDPHTD